MELGLKGKVALVTGASRGIGYGVAHLLAKEGCRVHLASRSAPDLEKARKSIIGDSGAKIEIHPADLGKPGACEALADRCGDIDILINNAGAIPYGSLTAMSDAQLREAWELKLFGFINLSRKVYPQMCAAKRGVIVNIIGLAGERPVAPNIGGTMANAALMAFTRALGTESPNFGVRVVGINPGAILTDRQEVRWRARAAKELGDEKRWPELTTDFPFGRLGSVEEVANLAVFLASDAASYITGTIVTIDGGRAGRTA
jgi:NAD(P)-dependent dehydrogenase (short-subunit alcohol dehydrogenase family)